MESWVPEACTLPTVEQPLRVAEFADLFRTSLRGVDRVAPTWLRLTLDAASEGTARDLAARESSCCSFFEFGFEAADGDVVLSVSVPEARVAVLDALESQALTSAT
jgi:hypothetical protein